jgi:hypothetical protein
VEKLNDQLLPLWVNPPHYASTVGKDDSPSGIKINDAGNILVIGNTEHDTTGGNTNRNWILLQYDHDGNLTGSGMSDGMNVTDDSPNAIFIKGSSTWIGGYMENTAVDHKDIAVQRFELPVRIKENDIGRHAAVFPNPVIDRAEVNVSLKGNYTFRVYSVNGSVVLEKEIKGSDKILFQKAELNPGIYTYRVTGTDNMVATGKFIIQ